MTAMSIKFLAELKELRALIGTQALRIDALESKALPQVVVQQDTATAIRNWSKREAKNARQG